MNPGQPAVLVVEHNRRNQSLVTELLVRHGYQALRAEDLDAINGLLDNSGSVQLALVDLSGLDQRVWQYCERFRLLGVPVVVIAPPAYDSRVHIEGMAHGAAGVLAKPVSPEQLLDLVNRIMSG